MADAKVRIGNSNDFLEGVSVNTPAGTNLFREGVVISDPVIPGARAEVRRMQDPLTLSDWGLVTHSVIQGRSTVHGGEYIDVKVNPSGALAVEVGNDSLPVTVLNKLVPERYDQVNLTYTDNNVTGVTYRLEGAIVAQLMLAYAGDNLVEVRRT